MKILVADDDEITLSAVSLKLKEKGYTVVTANNGITALDRISIGDVDLVISDVMMPGISGLTLVSLLKQYYFNQTPCILISSLNQLQVISKSLDLGACDYIVKPIDFLELFKKIEKLKQKPSI